MVAFRLDIYRLDVRKKDALPLATWVMSHVLSNVVSRHCDDLRIIARLQQPRQDPVGNTRQKVKAVCWGTARIFCPHLLPKLCVWRNQGKNAELNHYFNVWIAQEGIKRILNFSKTLRLLRTKVGDLEEHKGLEFKQSWWQRENRTVMRRSQTERWGFCTECQWAQSTVLMERETTQTENWCFILRWSQSRDWTHAQTHARRHTQKRKSPR